MMYINLRERSTIGVKRQKRVELKIDMTPTVDLGFLLISFFIFTTEISKPSATKLYMPHDGSPTDIADSKSLTILIKDHDQVFYFFGTREKAFASNQVFKTSYNEITGLGDIIRRKQHELDEHRMNQNDLFILIKPGPNCVYEDVVNVLDEMLIDNVTKYAITDLQPDEKTFLKGSKL